jgi:hypothetical protein
MKGLTVAAVCLALLGTMSTLSAHDDYRIIGTVAKATATSLEVKQTKDGKVIAMIMHDATIVTRDKKKVPRAELKAGVHVVVDAQGDSLDELEVTEVRLVPPPKGK